MASRNKREKAKVIDQGKNKNSENCDSVDDIQITACSEFDNPKYGSDLGKKSSKRNIKADTKKANLNEDSKNPKDALARKIVASCDAKKMEMTDKSSTSAFDKTVDNLTKSLKDLNVEDSPVTRNFYKMKQKAKAMEGHSVQNVSTKTKPETEQGDRLKTCPSPPSKDEFKQASGVKGRNKIKDDLEVKVAYKMKQKAKVVEGNSVQNFSAKTKPEQETERDDRLKTCPSSPSKDVFKQASDVKGRNKIKDDLEVKVASPLTRKRWLDIQRRTKEVVEKSFEETIKSDIPTEDLVTIKENTRIDDIIDISIKAIGEKWTEACENDGKRLTRECKRPFGESNIENKGKVQADRDVTEDVDNVKLKLKLMRSTKNENLKQRQNVNKSEKLAQG